jgi:hypothetical protein
MVQQRLQWCNGLHASEVLQQLDLTQRALGQDLLAEDVGHFLDGHALARLVVGSCTAGPLLASDMRLTAAGSYQTMPYAPCPSSLVTL